MPRTTLDMQSRFLLMKLVEAEYSEAAKSDAEFSRYASEKLNAIVNTNHILHIRQALKIPSYRTIIQSTAPATLRTLELRVAALELLSKRFSCYIDGTV